MTQTTPSGREVGVVAVARTLLAREPIFEIVCVSLLLVANAVSPRTTRASHSIPAYSHLVDVLHPIALRFG